MRMADGWGRGWVGEEERGRDGERGGGEPHWLAVWVK